MRIASLLVFLLTTACADSVPVVPPQRVVIQPVDVTPVAPKAAPVYDAAAENAKRIAQQRQEAQAFIDEKRFFEALGIYQDLYPDGHVTKDEFELVFVGAMAQMDELGTDAGLPTDWLERDEEKFRPFVVRYYQRIVEVLKRTGQADLGQRKSLHISACLDESGEVLVDMAELAEKIGKTKDARTWRIYHADHLSSGSGLQCEGEGRFQYAYVEQAYEEYVALGLTKDAQRTAEKIGEAYLENFDWSEEFTETWRRDEYCGEDWLDTAAQWFAKAGWSQDKIDRQAKERTAACKANC